MKNRSMPHISPSQFKDAFLSAFESMKAEVNDVWDDNKELTNIMLGRMMVATSSALSLKSYREYYQIDCIFYTEKDAEHFLAYPDSTYAQFLSVAIEVENNRKSTSFEMNRLQIYNTPLKVLITYAYPPEHLTYLNSYAEIIRAADIFEDFATKRRQLVIFGSTENNAVVWHFYVYEQSGFVDRF